MSTPDAADRASPQTVPRQRHPHPGESIPRFARPTFALAAGALIVFGVTAVAAMGRYVPVWAIILLSSAVTYAMFMVAHEALHRSLCSVRWVNSVVGRLAWIFVLPSSSFSAFRYNHIQHHRYANDVDNDPDVFATHAPVWQLPFRWALVDVFNAAWYLRRLRGRFRHSWRRPVAEVAEAAIMFSLWVVGLRAAIVTGNFWIVAVVVLIPQRIGLFVLGWGFDWLPHHGLKETQRENRYRASRIRVGMEWLLTPVFLSQNYHLIHHLHPSLPFYRYRQTWRRNEDAYLEHDAAVSGVFGRQPKSEVSRA